MKRLTLMIILAVLACLVCGCEAKDPDRTTTPTTTAAPTETTPILQTEPVTEPTTEPTIPVDENIEFFTTLLTPYYNTDDPVFRLNYYNMAMCCEFSCPEELPLATFFVNGFYGVEVTKEEQAYVSDFFEAKRLEPDMINEVLLAYFDITLDDINWDVVGIRYWEKTGCYYTLGNDVLENDDFVITRVEELENGIIKIHYDSYYPSGKYTLTLQSRESEGGEGYRILSNTPTITKYSWWYGDVPIDATIWPEESEDITYLTEEDIEVYMRLFAFPGDRFARHQDNPFNMAMCCAFTAPENVQLHLLFYNGFLYSDPITQEERDFLQSEGMDVMRLDPDLMNPVLENVFGITLDDINWDVQRMTYWEKTGCYYLVHSDCLMLMDFEIIRGYATKDGIIKIHYKGYFDTEYVITLQSLAQYRECGYHIISNLPLK